MVLNVSCGSKISFFVISWIIFISSLDLVPFVVQFWFSQTGNESIKRVKARITVRSRVVDCITNSERGRSRGCSFIFMLGQLNQQRILQKEYMHDLFMKKLKFKINSRFGK